MKAFNNKDDQLLQRVGAKLRELRQEHRMSTEEVEAATGISLTEIEVGKKDIKLDALAALCQHYRKSMVDFQGNRKQLS